MAFQMNPQRGRHLAAGESSAAPPPKTTAAPSPIDAPPSPMDDAGQTSAAMAPPTNCPACGTPLELHPAKPAPDTTGEPDGDEGLGI